MDSPRDQFIGTLIDVFGSILTALFEAMIGFFFEGLLTAFTSGGA